jgi:hypothetical protein
MQRTPGKRGEQRLPPPHALRAAAVDGVAQVIQFLSLLVPVREIHRFTRASHVSPTSSDLRFLSKSSRLPQALQVTTHPAST